MKQGPNTSIGEPAGTGLPGNGLLALFAVILVAGLSAVAAAWRLAAAPAVAQGMLAGVLIAALGSVSWLVLLRFTFHRAGRLFMGGLIGGLTLRMLLYGVAILVVGLTDAVHLAAFITALFASHLAYLAIEVVALHRSRQRAGLAVAAALALLLAPATLSAAVVPQAHPPAPVSEQAAAQDAGHAAGSAEAKGGEQDEAHGGEHKGFDVLHHVADSKEIETPFGSIHLPEGWVIAGIDFAPTKHVVWMWISAALLTLFVLVAVRSTGTVSRGVGNFLESIVVFIRDEVSAKNISNHPEKFTPYLCSLFFFILFCNLVGLIPFGATATGNLNMTAGLAGLSLIMIQAAGIAENGLVAHIKALCPIPDGVPGWLLPLYVPIIITVETVGIFAKPVALALRLFANMTAGHVVIVSLLALIFVLKTHFVIPVSVAFALFIYCLEVLVGVVQAYIFTMLTALFIGMSQHPAH